MGYQDRDAVKLILEKNLYGLDIDRRAYQLAYFVLMMKARQYDRRALRAGISDGANSTPTPTPYPLIPNVYHPAGWSDGEDYGSLVKVDSDQWAVDSMPTEPENPTMFDNYERDLRVWNFKRLLAQKYDVVVTNPPYMGGSGMSGKLSEFVKREYPDSKSDLFAAFIERCAVFTKPSGYQAMITQHAWMFLSSYEKLRTKLITNHCPLSTITSMAHLGARAFAEIGGEVVQSTAFVLRGGHISGFKGTYVRLVDYADAELKEQAYLTAVSQLPTDHSPLPTDVYAANSSNFAKIPGSPVAYWVGERVFQLFETCTPLKKIAKARLSIYTGDNNQFVRCWWEIESAYINSLICHYEDSFTSEAKWYFYNKGGVYQTWYGNNELVVNYYKGGKLIKQNGDKLNLSYNINNATDVFFHQGITWTALTSAKNSFRYSSSGHLFDSNKGPMIFPTNEDAIYFLLALFISPVAQYILRILNSSLSLQNGEMDKFPIISETADNELIVSLSKTNVETAKFDWDAFETSWDFKRHPLVEV
jgi:hypothetical protein